MKKNILSYSVSVVFLILFAVVGISCSQKDSSKSTNPSLQGAKQIEYYTCSMHPHIHSDKPGNCPICGMQLTPVYKEDVPPMNEMPSHSGSSDPKSSAPQEKKILYYVDPMHPQYKSDKPGKAPDCGMDLVPVYDDAAPSSKPASQAPGRSSIRLSSEKQQLIGVRTDIVTRKPLTREIHATGRVAYDPNLLVAQNEYLLASKFHPQESSIAGLQNNLVKSSKLRLQLLGMSEDQIRQLSKSNKTQGNLILPGKGGEVWIYASLFESDLPWVKTGTGVEVWIPGNSDPQQAKIESVDPVIDPATRTAQVRLRISNSAGLLKPEMYLKLNIQAQEEETLAIPSDAVLSTGNRHIAFVDLGNGKFEPRNLKIGRQGSGVVEILAGLSVGERIVTSANFLIDSESQLKSALSGMGSGEMEKHPL